MKDFNNKCKYECDDCSIKGICSLSPVAAAMKSVIFAFLQELAFYIIRVRAFGGRNEKIKKSFIETFSFLISNSEYAQESLNTVINDVLDTLALVKELYQELCKKSNSPVKYYKTQIKLNKNFTITDVIKQGHKYTNRFKQSFNQEQRNGFDVILIILKSICLYLVELQGLDVDIDNYYLELLSAVETHSFEGITNEQIIEYMKKIAKLDYELINMLYEARQEKYGKFIQSNVLTSHKTGKAILVSGTDMKEMEILLEATKDKGIDVYTHGQMITAHALPKLKAYPHLVGHYGKGFEAYITDFSSFPGSVFLTKLSLFRVESLYRGGIFTTDKIVSSGMSRITDYDFEPLIKSALMAEGFEEESPYECIKVGFFEDELNKSFDDLTEKIKDKKIKNIFIVGVSDKTHSQKEYLEKFFSLINNDSFIFSFTGIKEKENILFILVDYTFPLVYKLLNIVLPLKEKFSLKVNMLFARCEPHTLPNLMYIKSLEVDKIYFSTCSPNLFNPALVDYILEQFDIRKYTSPEADFKLMTED